MKRILFIYSITIAFVLSSMAALAEMPTTNFDHWRPQHHHHYYPPHPMPQQECVRTLTGDEVCGYHCAKSKFGSAQCASTPDQYCMAAPFGDTVACGYQCMASRDTVKCTHFRHGNCAKTAFDVKCGINCRVTGFNEIVCDREG